jgi:metal-responsive CopG/Arc/MetJ family transcriptional regulator
MQVQITTSLPKELVEQLDSFAKQNAIKKNQIIEESIEQFLLNEKKKRFANSFKKAALDSEIVNLAEEGLKDYKKQLKNLNL